MKLYQLCKEVVDDYVDYVEGFEVSTNREYLEEVAYNLNLEEYFDNYFVRELNLKQEAYYYTEIRNTLKEKELCLSLFFVIQCKSQYLQIEWMVVCYLNAQNKKRAKQ